VATQLTNPSKKGLGWKGAKMTSNDPYQRMGERVPFDAELMKEAIDAGLEVGIFFQSNNKKYKMPMLKFRIIMPVALGYDKEGRLMLRGVHIIGQSEKEAIKTGKRSAEAKMVWRLFNTNNMKSMFLTGNAYSKVPIEGYKSNDSALSRTITAFNTAKAKKSRSTLPKDSFSLKS
jgi:hypothetical protein